MNLMHLKSGTDVRGVAVAKETTDVVELTDEAIKRITGAFVYFLCAKTGKEKDALTVSVGHDSRISAERIKADVIAILLSMGVAVKDCGLCSTPAMFMTTQLDTCDGAVQITASHHPWDRNGLKFFTAGGGLSSEEIEKILEFAEMNDAIAYDTSREAEKVDFMSVYCEHLRNLIKKGVNSENNYDRPLEGLKIVVDAGNGVGGFFANDVLAPLGADTNGSRYLDTDGMFPNHIPNPENETAMASICEATVESGADLGVIFDTDVDRAACVSADGKEINRNRLVALAAAIALEGCEGGTVVTDSVTSAGLTEFIENTLGGKHRRFKRGYKNVIDESIRLESEGITAPLAIETSGHAAFSENYHLDDGAYLITRIIIKLAELRKEGKTLESLIASLKEPAEEKELRFKINAENFKEYGESIIDKIEKSAILKTDIKIAEDSCEGVKVIFTDPEIDGFYILRMSVHDPVMPMNIESAVKGGVRKIAQSVYDELQAYELLDMTSLKQFLEEGIDKA